MAEHIQFISDGLWLSGLLHLPENWRLGERRPAFVVMHGFGGTKESGQGAWVASALE